MKRVSLKVATSICQKSSYNNHDDRESRREWSCKQKSSSNYLSYSLRKVPITIFKLITAIGLIMCLQGGNMAEM
jgi:hypothetical protein